ncbi:MAG: class I SAM-dependent methyltransferase [Patescibacteria group bacterium]
MKSGAVIKRGGTDTERLYLESLDFKMPTGENVQVTKTASDVPGYNMKEHIARHTGRYALLNLYGKPGNTVLDFPCGSGYASKIAKNLELNYEGKEFDRVTVEYARRLYGAEHITFNEGDFTKPNLSEKSFDIIACIEGLEHMEQKYQLPLIQSFYKSLKKDGVLIVSSPENPTGKSGPSITNKDHIWELTRIDFSKLLSKVFGEKNVELLSYKARLSTGVISTCFYGVCHKN